MSSSVQRYGSYGEYVEHQRRGYLLKRTRIWACPGNIERISNRLASLHPEFGICHGTRSGAEQKWFMKYLIGCRVMGTEIGDVSDPDTVNWDFNIPYSEWIGKADFVYSNAFDHVFDPAITLGVWAAYLRKGGLLVLEWGNGHEQVGKHSRMDPFRATLDGMVSLIPTWLPGWDVVEIMELTSARDGRRRALFIGKTTKTEELENAEKDKQETSGGSRAAPGLGAAV